MAATSRSDFGSATEALEVAEAFADRIRGKTIIVTGVNRGGIGYATAEAFASQSPAHLIVAGRTPSKLTESIDALKAQYPSVGYRPLQLDLSKQQAVRTSASEVLSWDDIPIIDILVNSAGVALLPERIITEDGIEMHFATNHIGHFLFTNLIAPKLISANKPGSPAVSRVVNVASGSPMWCYMRWSDTNFETLNKDLPDDEKPNFDIHKKWGSPDVENQAYVPLEAYNQSKVANLLFSIGLNKRLQQKNGVMALTAHPGWIKTDLTRSAPDELTRAIQAVGEQQGVTYKTLGAGAATSLVAALDPKLAVEAETKDGKENYGVFLADCQLTNGAHPKACSSSEAEKLWTKSEDLVKQKFEW